MKTATSPASIARRRDSLARAFEVEELRVTAAPGRLAIEGSVPSYQLKKQAGQAAARLFGITNVVNLLRVVPERRRPDDDLLQAVQAALARCKPLARTRLDVSARQGVVLLRGRVRSRAARCEAERRVWAVAGINNVRNSLRVSGTSAHKGRAA